jgi:hypothetical protein
MKSVIGQFHLICELNPNFGYIPIIKYTAHENIPFLVNISKISCQIFIGLKIFLKYSKKDYCIQKFYAQYPSCSLPFI